MKPLILVGGGGHCKSVIDVAESMGHSILGILDLPKNVGHFILGYPVLGTDDDIPLFVNQADFIVTVGFIKESSLRLKIHDKIRTSGGHLGTLIASTAYVSRHAQIGAGTVVMHHAFVNAGARIGSGCIINTFVNVEHDALIGDNCHISTGAMVNGDCKVGECSFLGSQSVMVNGTSIISGCIIGAGSVVRKDILEKGIYSGNPAILKIKPYDGL